MSTRYRIESFYKGFKKFYRVTMYAPGSRVSRTFLGFEYTAKTDWIIMTKPLKSIDLAHEFINWHRLATTPMPSFRPY